MLAYGQAMVVRLAAVALVALVVVPALLRDADHRAHAGAAPCAVCVATRHSPALADAPPACTAPAWHGVALEPARCPAPGAASVPCRGGRAPPARPAPADRA
jgi:hypothetical protein